MFCTVCGKENREGAKFCRYCGHKLEEEILCPRCGSQMDEEDLFCERCGYKKGEELVVKPIVEEKKVEEYPVFESETPIEYGDEKPIIEEYDVPNSNKTIEDYSFDDYEEIPPMEDPFVVPRVEETFSEIEKNIPVFEKKEVIQENKKEEKLLKKEEKLEKEKKGEEKVPDGKFINGFILFASLIIMTMFFMPFYSSRGNGEYIRDIFASIRKDSFLNYISFIKMIFKQPQVVLDSQIDSIYYLIIVVGITIGLICMIKILFFAASNLRKGKYNTKYDKPFVITFVCVTILYVACNVNSFAVYVVLALSLAVLIHKYFYEKKFQLTEFLKTTILLSMFMLFLIAYRNIGINATYDGYTSWSKLGVGKYFAGLSSSLNINEGLNYIRDLITFLGWSVTICLVFGLLMLLIAGIKIIKAIYSDEPSFMPIVSTTVSVCMIIASAIFFAFARNNCDKRESAFIEGSGFNGWIVFALLLGVALCAIFGLMNYKTKKEIRKQENLKKE